MRRILITFVVATAAWVMPASVASAAFPGGNGDIAFGRSSRHQVDIWVVAAGVTGTTRLTNTPRKNESMPDWNATGTRVAYARCRRSEVGNCDIVTVEASSGDITRLTSTPDVQETWPAWSPDGSKIAFTSNADDVFQDIWVMDADGSNPTRLTTTTSFDAFPEWSPDGSSIVFTSDRAAIDDIWIMDADGANAEELLNTRRDAFAPAFSPNGKRIAFNRIGRHDRIGVWIMRVDGTVRVQKTFGRIDFFPDWQPI